MKAIRVIPVIALALALSIRLLAQGAPPTPAPRAGGPGPDPQGRGAGRGATFPAQQRPPGDPAIVERGRTLYGINCASCHGPDARGGDQGGPNLLRSQLMLDDQHGELILPVVQGSRQNMGMDPLNIPAADVTAIAEFIHSLAAGRGRGAPQNILVGNATAGQAAFTARCASCHSVTGDLKGLATRIPDPLTLQNFWISGGGGAGRGGGGGAGPAPIANNVPATTVTVTLPSGQKAEGRLVRIDDFLVTLIDASGANRTFRRDGDRPKVEVHDPLEPHRLLLPKYTDNEIHDLTAYLVTMK